MGEALSFKKVQITILAAVAALALGCALSGVQAAYADEGQYQAGTLLSVQANDPGVTSEQGSGASKAEYTTAKNGKANVTYAKTETTGTTAKVPDTVKINGKTYKVTAVAANAFKGNKKITTVTIGKNVTTIGKGAFQNCTKLNKVTLGKGVKTISANAFKGAKKLKTLTINSSKLTKKGVKGALKGSKIKTVKVPKAKVKAYKKIFTKANCGVKVTVKAK